MSDRIVMRPKTHLTREILLDLEPRVLDEVVRTAGRIGRREGLRRGMRLRQLTAHVAEYDGATLRLQVFAIFDGRGGRRRMLLSLTRTAALPDRTSVVLHVGVPGQAA